MGFEQNNNHNIISDTDTEEIKQQDYNGCDQDDPTLYQDNDCQQQKQNYDENQFDDKPQISIVNIEQISYQSCEICSQIYIGKGQFCPYLDDEQNCQIQTNSQPLTQENDVLSSSSIDKNSSPPKNPELNFEIHAVQSNKLLNENRKQVQINENQFDQQSQISQENSEQNSHQSFEIYSQIQIGKGQFCRYLNQEQYSQYQLNTETQSQNTIHEFYPHYKTLFEPTIFYDGNGQINLYSYSDLENSQYQIQTLFGRTILYDDIEQINLYPFSDLGNSQQENQTYQKPLTQASPIDKKLSPPENSEPNFAIHAVQSNKLMNQNRKQVQKIKNFHKNIMNVIIKKLYNAFEGEENIQEQILRTFPLNKCSQSDFLLLFNHLEERSNETISQKMERKLQDVQIVEIRKKAFQIFEKKFYYLTRIFKSNKKYKNIDEFYFSCLLYSDRESKFSNKKPKEQLQNVKSDLLTILKKRQENKCNYQMLE